MITILLILIFSTAGLTQISGNDKLLLDEILENYSNYNSYQDSGTLEVTTIFHEDSSTRFKSANFTTVYSKKKGFRFSFSLYNPAISSQSDLIIHKARDSSFSSYCLTRDVTQPKIIKQPLNFSIAYATGITYGLTMLIPKFLMDKELEGKSHFEVDSLVRIEDVDKLGKKYYRFKIIRIKNGAKKRKLPPNILTHPKLKNELKDFLFGGGSITEQIFWFNQETLLLERLEQSYFMDIANSKFMFKFFPNKNLEIDDTLFQKDFPKW